MVPVEKKLRLVYSAMPLPPTMSLPGAVVRQNLRGTLRTAVSLSRGGKTASDPVPAKGRRVLIWAKESRGSLRFVYFSYRLGAYNCGLLVRANATLQTK